MKREKILTRMLELVADPDSPWEAVFSRYREVTVRRTWTRDTPEHHARNWSEPRYHAYTFLTSTHAGGFILGTSVAPWMGRQDRQIPLWLVEAILEDPELSHDIERQRELKDARHASGSSS